MLCMLCLIHEQGASHSEHYKSSLNKIFTTIRSHYPLVPIMVMTIPPISEHPNSLTVPIIRDYNEALQKVAESYDRVHLIDVNSRLWRCVLSSFLLPFDVSKFNDSLSIFHRGK